MIYALGAFDGFHVGHRQLFSVAEARAEENNTSWGVMTFLGHPQELFNRDSFKSLFLERERDILADYFGIPTLCRIPFDRKLANMTPNEFVDFIDSKFDIEGLVVGENFRFGKNRSGDTDFLFKLCRERDWTFDALPSYRMNGTTVNSSAIRDLVDEGHVPAAGEMLGHPYFISGKVTHGDARGRLMQYPTANISTEQGKLYPAIGSYSALVYIDGGWLPTALNIGHNPTFEGARPLRCEAHVIGYKGNLYEKALVVFLIARNRGEIKFSSERELAAQLRKDIKNIKEVSAEYISDNRGAILKDFEALL
ncbi:MAG: riboflavin biosynthesis protein RibF [Synergistaceae bacterium]|nr:riboflavin biosynthesis protein RibF [Synergistaceae bacterium]